MSDEILCSPVRMIAFHSGKYDYAEVRLDAPLHLMGANNVGKTSLIAMLQFLYLDDQRKMHFSHPLPETRRYYFPDTYSYILFECRTPEGMAVVGVHGLGAARQFEFERFVYRGRFEKDDFLKEDQRMHDVEAVKARLAGKGFAKLGPKHLRAALTGVGDDRDVRLGLVPLRDRSQYDRFRFLFCNLLRLAQLRQDELKELLVEIYRNEFQQLEIDLSVEYRERFNRLQRDAQAVNDLRWIKNDIARLLEIVAARDASRRVLPVLWTELGRLFTARESELKRIEEEKRAEREKLQLREDVLKEESKKTGEIRDELLNQLGGLRSKLEGFQALGKSMADFMPDWAQRRRDELKKESATLQASISRLEGEQADRIAARIQRLEKDRGNAVRMRDSAEHLLLAKMRGEFDDADIAELFRLLNPELLHVDEKNVELHNSVSVRMRMEKLLEKFSGDAYGDGDISIELGQVPPPDITGMVDPETLAQKVDELERQIRHETLLLEASRDREGLEAKLQQQKQEEEELLRSLIKWSELCEQKEQAEGWTSDIQTLETESASRQDEIESISNNIKTLETERQQLTDAAVSAAKTRQVLLEKQRRLSPPNGNWEAVPNVQLPDGFDDLYEYYLRSYNDESRFAEETDDLLNLIQDRTYEKYNGQSEKETLHRLADAVEALGNREEALRKSWADFAVSLRSSFSALSHDLERLEGKVADLNRQMGKVTVSNLDAVRLIVSERPEWTKRIKSLCDLQDDLPLFGEGGTASNDMEELGRLLEQAQSVGLHDLFDLHFEIQGSDGKERRYTNLDKIESNGTTITIKVLVHLILLRDLMSGGRAHVPFYLDEVSSLDHDNIAGIIQQAKALDFVPVLASPDSVEEVDRIYMLAENADGRIVLDDTALIEFRRDHATN
jgi:hypothetical protein